MKTIPVVLLASVSFVASSWAGEIYGTIKESARPVKNIPVTIKGIAGKTDEYGNYRILVADVGRCPIIVQFNGKPVSGEVQSYPTPVRFDWILEKTGDTYSLKRQ